eukprot:1717428-Amphidinium_carterae.1
MVFLNLRQLQVAELACRLERLLTLPPEYTKRDALFDGISGSYGSWIMKLLRPDSFAACDKHRVELP